MLDQWLEINKNDDMSFVFRLINIVETTTPEDHVKDYLGQEILKAYKNIDYLKFIYREEPQDKLIKYITEYVLPSGKNQIAKNVQQGDFGEILASLIVEYFMGLTVPIRKLRWKFNHERSMFCTDMIAHNTHGAIKDIYYYEVKTRLIIRKEQFGNESNYITVNAYNSLLKDEKTPNEGIANFLSNYYYEINDYDAASKYSAIVNHPERYNRNFELFFVIEKAKYIDAIIDDLQNSHPTLSPLCVTVVLIDQLGRLILAMKDIVIANAINYVYT